MNIKRVTAAALSVTSAAFVGIGGMSAAQAEEAGVRAPHLTPVSATSTAVVVDPAALPGTTAYAARFSVDERGRLSQI